MTDESQQDHCATRRCVLLGAGVLGAAGVLSACSTAAVPYDANMQGQAPGQAPVPASTPTTALEAPSAADSGAMTSNGAMASSPSSGAQTGGTVLGVAAEIPVGGGKVYQGANVVVTQPTAGQYKAFSAVCTHVGCICNQVAAGTINCPCHGAKFKITDGSVVAGPATTPLAAAPVTVSADGKIYLK